MELLDNILRATGEEVLTRPCGGKVSEAYQTVGKNGEGRSENAEKKMKVYAYTRVFTAMQVDGYSLDGQKAKMKVYIDYNDYEIVDFCSVCCSGDGV